MKKKVQIKFTIIFTICFVLAAVLCILRLPEIKALQMAIQLKKEIQVYHNPLLEEIEPFEIYKNREEVPYTDEITLNIGSPMLKSDRLSSETFHMDQASFHYNGIYYNQEKKLKGDFELGALNLDVVKGKLLVDKDKAYFAFPDVLSDSYYIDFKRLGKDFNQSEIAQLLDISLPKDLDINFFCNTQKKDWDELEKYKEELFLHAKNLKSYVKLENSYDSVTVQKGNNEVKGKAISLIIQPYAINDMLKYIDVVCLKSELYKSQAKHLFIKDSFRDLFEEDILGANYTENVILNLYLDNKNRLLEIENSTPLVIGDNEKKIFFDIQLVGETNSLSDVKGSLSISENQQKKEYEYEIHTVSDDHNFSNRITVVDKMKNQVTYEDLWDKNNKSFSAAATTMTGNELNEIVLKGTFEAVKPKEGFTFHIADFHINTNGEERLRAAGEVKAYSLGGDVNFKTELETENAKNLFTLTKKDMFGIVFESMQSTLKLFFER